MTKDSTEPPRPKHLQPRQGERRQVNALKGVPLTGGLGLVFNERRTHRERRRLRRPPQSPPCALLQDKSENPHSRGILGNVSSGLERTAIGAWLKRRLKRPWRR